jgi:transcriptional regulator with XRE-family HTH domain
MNKNQYNINLGNAIRELRHELDLSQEKLANKAGLCRTYIGSIERGEKSISVYNLYKLLESVNVPINKFLERV